VAYLAAWQSLVEVGHLEEGERILITGAAGAVGTAATQIAHWKGAVVFGSDIGEPPEDADVSLNVKEVDLPSAVLQATGGNGVDWSLIPLAQICSMLASVRFGWAEDN
jgi:NADPH:quinone reductase